MNINCKETLTIEFKSDRKKLSDDEIIEVVVAFANTEGGELYLGVEDNGDITGLHPDHMNIIYLSAFIANKTVPPISVRTEIIDYDKPVLKVSVPKKTSIVATSSGKILRRRIKTNGEPENVPLYPYEISSRLSELSLLDFSAQPVPDASYDDLDPLERMRVRRIIETYRGEQNLLELNDREFDQALQFITMLNGRPVPTYTGMLILGKQEKLKALVPTAESAIQIFSGTDIKVNESFTLPIVAAFEKINAYVQAYNYEEELEIGLFRITVPYVEKRAFREALVNAYCHRDYSLLGRVRIQLQPEGLTITNPGGFIEGISIHNLLYAEPSGRNPALADALKRIGLAERTGRGIDRIFEGSLAFGKALPDYSGTTSSLVKLFIPNSIPDKAFVEMISKEESKTGRGLPLQSLMVLNCLKSVNQANIAEITAYVGGSESSIRVTVEALNRNGLIEAKGSGRGRTYMLGAKAYQTKPNRIAYVRQSGIDSLRYEELILKLAKTQGAVTRANVADLLHLSAPQAYRRLKKMTDKGLLTLVGKGPKAYYTLKE